MAEALTDQSGKDTSYGQTPVIGPGYTFASVTDKISSIVLRRRTPRGWIIGFAISFLLANMCFLTIGHLVLTGIGIWGNNIPVGWAFDIINFVWWIGIGHAGMNVARKRLSDFGGAKQVEHSYL